MPTIVTVTSVWIIVPGERIAALAPLLVARFEQDETYLAQKEKYQGLLSTLAPDQLLLWLLGMMGWRVGALPNGDIRLFGRYHDDLLDFENDPFLACAEQFVEEGSYVEGWASGNQAWQLLYTEKGRVTRTTNGIFPHYRPKLPNGTTPDIVTEHGFWRLVEQAALWYLRLSEGERVEALQDYEDDEDLQQQVCHAISNAMIPGEFQEYVALMQVIPDIWNLSYPNEILEDDESPTPQRVFDLTLKRLVYEHLEERWKSLELEAHCMR
ncbi:hypothetical protein KSF_107730 [Reticulibacter mediterranei]|uniref:Uncharacterized protein n=1 Tax=Reticulibacter mediterranei TaxID=2778369 RepID=A0A8J3J1S1_9CHLR|nr:hypothetical protein [Reticulibacter mediterranei]GHP00726.1 hypothetical protein KSF_107730 [Reticulibacter mediterranei]